MQRLFLLFLILHTSIPASAQVYDTLSIYMAQHFAGSAFHDSRIIPLIDNVFIRDEANIHTLNGYKGMQANGYIHMTLTDSSHCCNTYNIRLLPKARQFVMDSMERQKYADPLVQTIRYDTLQVLSVIKREGYHKINYQIINLEPTPMNIYYYEDPAFIRKHIHEDSCFVRFVNGGWQIDDDSRFRGFSGPKN